MGEKKSNIWHVVLFEDVAVTREAVERYCRKTQEVKLCAREATDENMRPHYHIAHHGEEICRSTMISRLKKEFPTLFGKGTFNCHTNKDGETIDGLYQYICKGADKPTEPDIVFSQPFLNIKALHEAYYVSADKFQTDSKTLAKQREKEARKKRNKVVAEAITYIAQIKHNIRFHIVEYIVAAYKGQIDPHNLTTMVSAVEFAKEPEATVNYFYNLVCQKLNPRL